MKFHLAVALSHQAKLLIMDEPTSGLDPFVRSELLAVLKKEAAAGRGILMSTHITEDILTIADRVVFIVKGKILFDLPGENIENAFYRCPASAVHTGDTDSCRVIKRTGESSLTWMKQAPQDRENCRLVSLMQALQELNSEGGEAW